jgi:prepilin-type N-terminal cleavage/methylation domain-containing protein
MRNNGFGMSFARLDSGEMARAATPSPLRRGFLVSQAIGIIRRFWMKRSGFTLIELLMASVILAILATIAIPNFTRMQMRAKESEVKSVCHMVQVAVEDYKTAPGQEGLKPSIAAEFVLVQTTYLPTTVQTKRNPFNMLETYGTSGLVFGVPGGIGQVGYQYYNQNVPYTISCMGGNARGIILTLIEGQ